MGAAHPAATGRKPPGRWPQLFRFSNLNKRDTRHCFPARMCSQGTVETCCLASQVSNFKRSKDPVQENATGSSSSSSTSACGRMITTAIVHGVGVPPPPVMSMSRCAHRELRQRPRRLRFRSDGHHLVYRTLQRRPGERAAFSAARPQHLRPGAVALFPRRGAPPPTPTRLRPALDLRPPRSSPLPGARLRIIRVELTIGGKAVRPGQASHAS